MTRSEYRGKRVLDVTVAAGLVIVTLPVLVALAVLVRLTSAGPAWHRARRIGRDGRPFTLYKFRSMRVATDRDGPGITAAGDPRVTTVGRFLRATKLDELPQLFNVLRGEMSVVGPRPEDPRYVERYTPEQREILRWRPGITSPASVTYRDEEAVLAAADDLDTAYAEVSAHKIGIDLAYFRQASLIGDLHWIASTVSSVLGPRRASTHRG